MKQLRSTTFLMPFLMVSPLLGQAESFPFFSDLESDPGGFVPAGLNSSWEWGTPASEFISSTASGERVWATNLDGLYAANENSYLEMPTIDCTGLVLDPMLQFEHIFRMGIDHPVWAHDETWVELSIDGGPYSKLGMSASDPGSLNWYNDHVEQWWDQNSGEADAWRTARHRLEGAAGHLVRVRFVFRSDSHAANDEDGVAIDDIFVFDSFTDVALSALSSPRGGSGLGAQEPLALHIENRGTEAVDMPSLDVVVVGPILTSFTETLGLSLAPGEAVDVVLAQTLDLSAEGRYAIDVTLSIPNDIFGVNDRVELVRIHQSTISFFPYVEDFESDEGQLVIRGHPSSWEYGTPSGDEIDSAASGVRAWATDLDGDVEASEESFLQLPPLDLTSFAVDPCLELAVNASYGASDYAFITYSIDGGSFGRLGPGGGPDSENWYSPSLDGWTLTDGWVTARHPIVGGAGHEVLLRIHSDTVFGSERDGVAIDDLAIFGLQYGTGQAPQPGAATLDSVGAVEISGTPVSSNNPGPYFVNVSVAAGPLDLHIEGEPNRVVALYAGSLSPNSGLLTGVGQIDLGPDVLLVAAGYLSGGINPLLVTNAAGVLDLAVSLPPTFIGSSFALQVLVDRAGPASALSNALEITALP